MVCSNCPPISLSEKKYVVDSSVGFGPAEIPEVKPFPYWILLLAAPLLLIPLAKKK